AVGGGEGERSLTGQPAVQGGMPRVFANVEEFLKWTKEHPDIVRVRQKDGTPTEEQLDYDKHVALGDGAPGWENVSGGGGWSTLGPGLPGGFRQQFGR